jgi:nitrate/nitrite transporter NarK
LALTFLLTVKIETEPLREGLRNLDWVGFVFIIGGTICFLLGLEFGPAGLKPWVSATTICLIVFGLLLLALFATWEAKIASNPIIPGRVFNSGTNAATFAVSCTHAFVFVSFDFFLPLYFQVILGMTPLISGVTIFALVLSSAITTMSGGFITRRTGNYKVLMIAGSCMMLLGGGLFINFDLEKQWPKIIIYQAIAGCGAGLLFQAPMIALQSHLKQKDLAAGMSAMNFLRSLVVSVSTVIGTIIMDQAVSSNSLTSLNDEAGERSDRKRYISGLHTLWAFYAGVSSIMLIGSFFVKQLPREKPSSASDKGISETPPLEKNNE